MVLRLRENNVRQQLEAEFFWKTLEWSFFSPNLQLLQNFAFQWYSDCKLAVIKQGMLNWSDSNEKMMLHNNLELLFSKILSDLVRGLNLVSFEKFSCPWSLYKCKMTTVNQEILDWPSNYKKMTLHSNFKLNWEM